VIHEIRDPWNVDKFQDDKRSGKIWRFECRREPFFKIVDLCPLGIKGGKILASFLDLASFKITPLASLLSYGAIRSQHGEYDASNKTGPDLSIYLY
jgi:hypothetical protein